MYYKVLLAAQQFFVWCYVWCAFVCPGAVGTCAVNLLIGRGWCSAVCVCTHVGFFSVLQHCYEASCGGDGRRSNRATYLHAAVCILTSLYIIDSCCQFELLSCCLLMVAWPPWCGELQCTSAETCTAAYRLVCIDCVAHVTVLSYQANISGGSYIYSCAAVAAVTRCKPCAARV